MIPQELKERPQWVCWRVEIRDGRPTKVPMQARHDAAGSPVKAATDRPEQWVGYERAEAFLAAHRSLYSGIGYVFTPDDGYVGIDLDDAFTMQRRDRTEDIVAAMDSYTELSPSGTGVHIILRGALPGRGRKPSGVGIEVYDQGRYFTFTGKPYGNPRPIRAKQGPLDRLLAQYMPYPADTGPLALLNPGDRVGAPMSDDAVLAAIDASTATVLKDLIRGEWAKHGYPSPSEADLALASYMAYWTGADYEQSLRLIQRTAMWDQKWERMDYQMMTLGKAVRSAMDTGWIAPMYFKDVFTRLDAEPREEVTPGSLLDSLSLRVHDAMAPPPVPVDLVPGLLPDPTWTRYGMLVGTGGLGKSMFSLQTAIGIASATLIAGYWQNDSPKRVLYLSGEDSRNALWNRVNRIVTVSGLTADEIAMAHDNLRILDLTAHLHEFRIMEMQDGNYVPHVDGMNRLVDWIRTQGGMPELVELDTLARFAPLAEENNANAAAFVAAIEMFAERLGCMVLVAHHTSKQNRATRNQHSSRGASALVDNSRHVINLTPLMDGKKEVMDRVELTIGKTSYMAREREPILLARGFGGVLHRITAPTREEIIVTEQRTDAQKRAAVLAELWGGDKRGNSYNARQLDRMGTTCRRMDITRSELLALVEELERDGYLEHTPRRGFTRRADEWSL